MDHIQCGGGESLKVSGKDTINHVLDYIISNNIGQYGATTDVHTKSVIKELDGENC